MSTTDSDGATPSEREPDERPSQRLHDLYRADLRPFEPVSDAQILGAIGRAEVHDQHEAGALLGAEKVPSDAWFDLAERLRKAWPARLRHALSARVA